MGIVSRQCKLFVKSLRESTPRPTYPEIEEQVFLAGHRDPNGKRISNAALSAETIADYPHLRVRKPNSKKKVGRPKGSKNKARTTGTSIKSKADTLRSKGFNDAQILKILELE